MTDTTAERLRLARLVRELERGLQTNVENIFKPWVAHPDHVRHYYQAYNDYLEQAFSFPELPQRDVFERRRKDPLFIHRDNLGSLAGRIGELGAALEASAADLLQELEACRAEATRLAAEVQRMTDQEKRLREELGQPVKLGGGRASAGP